MYVCMYVCMGDSKTPMRYQEAARDLAVGLRSSVSIDHVCMYVYTYTMPDNHAFMRLWTIQTCMHAHIHTQSLSPLKSTSCLAYTHTHTHTYIRTYVHTSQGEPFATEVDKLLGTHTHIHTYIHHRGSLSPLKSTSCLAYTHTYIQTYIHTYITGGAFRH